MSTLATDLEALVKDVELRSDAEVVVVLAARSAEWPQVAWAVGAAAGWLTLAALAWLPQPFEGAWFPVEVAFTGAVAGWLASRSDRLPGYVVPRRIRAARVAEAARAAFVEEAVHATRGRTGVLLYVSALERRAVLLADQGVLARLPRARIDAIDFGEADAAAVMAGLRALGDLLAEALPATHHNPDELPDAPRVRP